MNTSVCPVVYTYDGNTFSATGFPTDPLTPFKNPFVVYDGSRADPFPSTSFPEQHLVLRRQLMASGVLVQEGWDVVFTRDYQFYSPSEAACIVSGNSRNGLLAWVSFADGLPLKDYAKTKRRLSG